MMRYLLLLLGSLLYLFSFGQTGGNNIVRQGNEQYLKGSFEESEKVYLDALQSNKDNTQASFNLGDALYRQGKFKESAGIFESIAENMPDAKEKSKAYQNLGNSLLQEKDYEKSLEAYKKSILADPTNQDARYNYEYARQKLVEQQKQNKKDDKDKDGDKDDKNKEDKKDGDKNDKGDKGDKDNKDKKEENKEGDKDKKEEGDNKDEKKSDEKDGDGEKKPNEDGKPKGVQPNQISKENAQRLLDALLEKEGQEQLKLLKEKRKKGGSKIEKDW